MDLVFLPDINDKNAVLSCRQRGSAKNVRRPASVTKSGRKKYTSRWEKYGSAGAERQKGRTNERLSVAVGRWVRGRGARVQEGTRGAEGQIRVGNWALLQMDRGMMERRRQLRLLFLLELVCDYSPKLSRQHSHPPLTICLPSTVFPLPTVLVPS